MSPHTPNKLFPNNDWPSIRTGPSSFAKAAGASSQLPYRYHHKRSNLAISNGQICPLHRYTHTALTFIPDRDLSKNLSTHTHTHHPRDLRGHVYNNYIYIFWRHLLCVNFCGRALLKHILTLCKCVHTCIYIYSESGSSAGWKCDRASARVWYNLL